MLPNRFVTGDIIFTTTNKVILTNTDDITNTHHITQYDYSTGVLEVDILISPTINLGYGLFQDNNQIYIMNGTDTNNVYHIDKIIHIT